MRSSRRKGALALSIFTGVLASAIQAATTTGTACGPTFNFFPASKNSSIPTAWTQSAQKEAGNTRSDMLYTVALTSSKNVPGIDAAQAAPELTVVPVHDLLIVGSNPSSICRGVGASATATAASVVQESAGAPQRRLLQAAVTQPARFRLQYKINSSDWVTVGEYTKTSPAPRIVLNELKNYTDGHYCMNIKLTIIAYSGLAGGAAMPVADLWTTAQVCFMKLDNLPAANVTYNSCGAPFTVNISDMQPAPVPLYPGSAQPLFQTVFRFQSSYNHSEDGSWPAEEPAVMEEWIVVKTAAEAKKPFLYAPEAQQVDGYWNVKLEGSLMTNYSSLMSLGIANIDRYTDETAPEEIQGQYKLAPNKMWPTGRLAGVQNVRTKFLSFNGPEIDGTIPVNSDMSFNWDWDGFGKQYCYFDGLNYYNAEEYTCRQPLEFKLPNSKNHTLTVLLQDVCGKNYTFSAAYGTWGYKLTKIPNIPADDTELNLESGTVYDSTTSTATTGGNVRRASTASSAGSFSRSAGMLLPAVLLMLL